jgi:predicted O-methyltransferase YrrM
VKTDHSLNIWNEYQTRAGEWSDIQDHLPFLHETARVVPRCRVLELGTRWGTSTAALLAAVDRADGHLWSVDIQPPKVPAWWADTGRWTVIVGDDLDPAVQADLPAEVDVLFIDTSHAYQHTLDELRAYVPRVRPGGVALLHDTELNTPEAIPPQPMPFPVAAALDTYCAETGLSWVNRPGCYGLGVLEVPA